MTDFLPGFIALLAMVCLLGFFNEKVTKLTYEISLMLFSTVLGIIIMVVAKVFFGQSLGSIFKYGGEDEFNIELSAYATALAEVVDGKEGNVFCMLAGGPQGSVLNLDAVYIYEKK